MTIILQNVPKQVLFRSHVCARVTAYRDSNNIIEQRARTTCYNSPPKASESLTIKTFGADCAYIITKRKKKYRNDSLCYYFVI